MLPLYKNILLVKNRALGDAILSISTGKLWRELFPHATITFATPAWTAPVFEELDHPFDKILPFDLSSFDRCWEFYSELLNHQFNLIYEMHQRPSSRRLLQLYAVSRGVDYFAYNHNQQLERRSIVQREMMGVMKALQLPFIDKVYLPSLQQRASKRIIFGVVATRRPKMLPLKIFLQLAQELALEYEIIIPLGPDDTQLKYELEKIGIERYAKIVELPLNKLSRLIKRSRLYIGNDTGLKHLAAYLGVKTISFFGPEEPIEWHPYAREDHPYLFIKDMSCRYEKAHYCGLNNCSHMSCMQFPIEDILQLISSATSKTEYH